MKTKLFTFAIIAFLCISCKGQTVESLQVIPASDFAEKIKSDPNAQILDVRTPEEYKGQHITNAVNVDWNGEDFAAKAAKFDKSKPVYVYCRSGGRSKKASEKLHEMGFTEIYDMQGGITKWNAEGLED